MRIRLVVADESEARFYNVRPHKSVELVGCLTDPVAHLRDRDLVSDRPGRKFDRAPLIAGRRGATARHATGGEQSPRQHEAEVFARRVEGLIVMSGPVFLGLLREALPESVRAALVAEVGKDLLHQGVEAVLRYLPPAQPGPTCPL